MRKADGFQSIIQEVELTEFDDGKMHKVGKKQQRQNDSWESSLRNYVSDSFCH